MANDTGLTFTFNMLGTDELLKKRNLSRTVTAHGSGSKAQQILDAEVVRHLSPYMPFDTGVMIDSMILHTRIGSGKIRVVTPYAKRRLNFARNNGLRGANYWARMKADHMSDFIGIIERLTGGRVKR